MEGVTVVSAPLLLWDTLVMVVVVGQVVMAGRVAGIEGGDRVGEVILCRPRTEIGAAWGTGGRFNSISARDCPGTHILTPKGLGLRLLKLPIGLVNPLLWPLSKVGEAGETTATWSPTSTSSKPAKIDAALSRTEGTEFSSCSVPFERGIRCGLGG